MNMFFTNFPSSGIKSLGLVVGESFWVLLFIVFDLNVVIVTSFILASLNVNFARKFAISNVVDVVHMSMNFGAKIWCHVFWEIRPNPKGGFLGSCLSC